MILSCIISYSILIISNLLLLVFFLNKTVEGESRTNINSSRESGLHAFKTLLYVAQN